MNVFTFRNEATGEVVQATSHSRNAAARQVGIEISYGQLLPHPWKAVSCCSTSGEVLWTAETL